MKKLKIILAAIVLLGIVGFSGFTIAYNNGNTQTFENSGYVLVGSYTDVKVISFEAGTKYSVSANGTVQFKSKEGNIETVDTTSFVYFDNDKVMALSRGVLFDFDDLSDNFINNYSLASSLKMTGSNNQYSINTSNGELAFGENIWKLTDNKYLIQSAKLKVHLSADDVREAEGYVQINITEDGIVQMLTKENLWMTISDECYIETDNGIFIFPTTTIVKNNTYQMSIAKLSVDADDNIVLSDAETRKQTVPRWNIETADGKNGADGQSGKSGKDGTGGKDGNKGDGGDPGNDAFVSSTNSSIPTMTIAQWEVTANSLQAVISINDVSGYMGSVDTSKYKTYIKIINAETDEVIYGYVCSTIENDDSFTITPKDIETEDPGTGAFNGSEQYVGFTTVRFDENGEPVGQETIGYEIDALEPDTRYKLSICGYYCMNEVIYNREFISRYFYTDSMGVTMSKGNVDQTTAVVKATLNADLKQYIKNISVYLLTEEENKAYNNGGNLPATSLVLQESGIDENTPDIISFEFKDLNPNSYYVARILVEQDNGVTTISKITKQELHIVTLKRSVTISKLEDGITNQIPQAYYNRTTGAFEIVRPIVTDIDGGIVNFVYTAYQADDLNTPVATKSYPANTSEMACLYLQTYDSTSGSAIRYIFRVQAEFYDNEKTVYIDLGKTEEIQIQGDTLPTIKLEYSKDALTYSSFTGDIILTMQANSELTVDANHPLKINIYADQIDVKNGAITFNTIADNTGSEKKDESGNNTYSITVIKKSGYITINLKLQNLYQNTKYAINVTGYVDLNDGNGDSFARSLGTVSFTTKKISSLTTNWKTVSNSTNSLEIVCRLTSDATGSDLTHTLDMLKKGQVTVTLYQGSGNSKQFIATRNYTDSASLASFFTEDVNGGYHIINSDFGNINILTGTDYSITISSVIDNTYALTLGYTNSFDDIQFKSKTITASAQAPKLTDHPENGVTATPIKNSEVDDYGGTINENLPADAIVGYLLQAQYNNIDTLAYSVTYYVYEYSEFYNCLVGTQVDPIRGDTINGIEPAKTLLTCTRTAEEGTTFITEKLPAVAILFGGGSEASTDDEATKRYYNKAFVYYSGDASIVNNYIEKGMCRGFRYVFAYTAKYTRTGSYEDTEIYPYDQADYNDPNGKSYAKSYGAGLENKVRIGVDNKKVIAYVLNSGMCNAPAIEPDFHTYLYSNEFVSTETDTGICSGLVKIRFRYQDYDNLINLTGANANNIVYQKSSTTTEKISLANCKLENSDWFEVSIPYTINNSTAEAPVLKPKVDITTYKFDYDKILGELNYIDVDAGESASDFYLCYIPLEWDWGTTITEFTTNYSVTCTQTANLQQNYIEFKFDGDSDVLDAIMARVYAANLTFIRNSDLLEVGMYVSVSVRNADAAGKHGEYYIQIPTGDIGTDFLGKAYTVTVNLLYDNGDQGWDMIADKENEAQFGMQKYMRITEPSLTYNLSNYSIRGGNSAAKPSGGLIKRIAGGCSIDEIQATVGDSDFKNPSMARLNRYYDIVTTGASSNSCYLYVDRYGITMSSSSRLENRDDTIIVLKGVSNVHVSMTNPEYTIPSMTPTVSEISAASNLTSFKIKNIHFAGLDQASIEEDGEGHKKIYIGLFENYDYADNEKWAYQKQLKETYANSDNQLGEVIEFTGLKSGTTYYYAVYVKMDGDYRMLMKVGTSNKAIFNFTTVSGVTITVKQQASFINKSYRNKKLTFAYGLNFVYGVTCKYDIYDNANCAGSPVLDNDTLLSSGMMVVPEALTTERNDIEISLPPSAARAGLQPGHNYWVKITAYVDGVEKKSEKLQFTVPTTGDVTALIFVASASKDSITFQVTINDRLYSLMTETYKDGDAEKERSVYAVRITDFFDNKIPTIYDNQIFYGNIRQQEIVFDSSTLTAEAVAQGITIKQETMYKLHVYSMKDYETDGQIVIDAADHKATAEEMMADNYKLFQETIDSFWTLEKPSSGYNKYTLNTANVNAYGSYYDVATRNQRTTTSASYYIEKGEAMLNRASGTKIELILSESFGIVSNTGVQAFAKLVWSVSGYTDDGIPVAVTDTVLTGLGGGFTLTYDNAGYPKYTFAIPYSIPYGEYKVTVMFYRFNDDSSLVETISLKIR